ncbi:SDR family NAD(P)-dependent oxidoreductase [Dielma fastidiosa]|uniref:SDR family NAD(P)-dependent oxidoreductase n=1 Tax=Dielma fastidiosa TaxID=1034346 RepID=UPI003564347D
MIIENMKGDMSALADKPIIITGGGGGIALEAGLALAYMGAKVIIGEVDEEKGRKAESLIAAKFPGRVQFIPLDLEKPEAIQAFCEKVTAEYGTPYAIINNAAITPFDSIERLPLTDWDRSYHVHLRGPLQMIQFFLPKMLEKNQGVLVFTPSSGAVAYMGGYEVFKTSQVELANTLAAELEDTGLSVYSIGPGLVKTQTAMKGIEKVAPLMGISTEDFYHMNRENIVSAQEAGTAFAVSLLFAKKYHGQEIGGIQALIDAGIHKNNDEKISASLSEEGQTLLIAIIKTFDEQNEGWKKRNIFEKQWMLRDFKKYAGHSADEMAAALHQYQIAYNKKDVEKLNGLSALLTNLSNYYRHQLEMMQGYIKDSEKRQEYDTYIKGWLKDIETMKVML